MKLENFKIRVTPETSRQVQELLFHKVDGVTWTTAHKEIQCLDSKFLDLNRRAYGLVLSHSDSEVDYISRNLPEKTIEYIQEYITFNRHDLDDATHMTPHGMYWRQFDGKWHYYSAGMWRQTVGTLPPEILKVIAKDVQAASLQKEYLDPSLNYELVLRTDYELEHSNTQLIPVPEGANYAYTSEYLTSILFFKDDSSQCRRLGSSKWFEGTYARKEFETAYRTILIWQRDLKVKQASTLSDQEFVELPNFNKSRTAGDIADAALEHVKDRAVTYDQPSGERSAAKTAKAFNAITGKYLTEGEVWLILQLVKDVRQWSCTTYHKDNAEDAIAYAALKAEALEHEQKTDKSI